jgi:hypothetical protein
MRLSGELNFERSYTIDVFGKRVSGFETRLDRLTENDREVAT